MLEALFGETPLALRFFIAFMVVLALMGTCAWLIQRFRGAGLTAIANRGRQPRLAVIDSASVDGRRRLLLVRRDNVEHLLMVGGPTDVLVEANIVRSGAARDLPPVRAATAGADTLPRPLPLGGEETTWPLQPGEPAPRPARQPSASEASWSEPQTEPAARIARSADTLAGLAEELSARSDPSAAAGDDDAVEPARARADILRAEPARTPPPLPIEAAITPAADQNLAEMAQRLEAALRRPTLVNDGRAPEAVARAGAAGAKADAGSAARGRNGQAPAGSESKARAPGKSLYDSLEQEMASLLGRPAGKS